jgi:hypothetical protein
MYENGEKTGGFAHILAYKSPKKPFFTQKYLIRYTHQTFFKEYMNFETHFLWIRVKPQPVFWCYLLLTSLNYRYFLYISAKMAFALLGTETGYLLTKKHDTGMG